MSQQLLQRLEKLALFFLIVFLPINELPKRVSIPGIGGNMSMWFFMLILGLMLYEYYKFRFEIPAYCVKFIVVYVGWQIVCLALGLWQYEYNNMLTMDQIPKLQYLLAKLSFVLPDIDDIIAIKFWLFVRSTKSIIFFSSSIFVMMFIVWHLYRSDFTSAFGDVKKAVMILFCFMGMYSIIELAWLKFNSEWAKNLLLIINPLLYDIEMAHGWWPPALWKGQLRSLSREPSFFGIISIFSMPFLWSYVFSSCNKIKYCLLLIYFTLMIASTNARTAIVVNIAQMILLFLTIFLFKNKKYIKTVALVIGISIIAYGLNMFSIKAASGNLAKNVDTYVTENIMSVAKVDSRSNSARIANLVANINTIKYRPLTGVGTGLQDSYIDTFLPEFSYTNYEVRNWSRYMHNEGVLKSGYPALNMYAYVAVQNGIIGLMLYLFPVSFILWYIFKNHVAYIQDYRVILLLISALGLLAAQLSNVGFSICNGIVWGLLWCKIEETRGME